MAASLGCGVVELRRHGAPLPLTLQQPLHEPARVVEAIHGLNKLSGIEFKQIHQLSHRPPTAVQNLVLDRIRCAVQEAGDVPDSMCPDSALRELMRSHSQYGDPSNLAPFDENKLKVLQSKFQPKDLQSLLPPHIVPLFKRRDSTILRPPQQVADDLKDDPLSCPKTPYWDPILKADSGKRARFLVKLNQVGIVGFRKRINAPIGLFFVKKKDPAFIRMVVDARISNFHHHPPPTTRLGSSANYTDLELSEDVLTEKLCHLHSTEVGFGAELDVADCFWQFKVDELAEWFGVQMPRPASFWAELGADVSEFSINDTLFPVITGMPMGWKWALFFANEVVAAIARQSGCGFPLELREKLPVSQLWEASSITSVYVDNVAVIGATFEGVQHRIQQIEDDFKAAGLPVVLTYDEPVRVFETVGVIVDFKNKKVSNRPRRLWRVYLAGKALIRRRKVLVHSVEVWLGHATSIFRLAPHFLAIFDKVYRFIQVHRGEKLALWGSVRSEIKLASSLVWLSFCNLGGKIIQTVDMGDSANSGYAMMTRFCSNDQILEATRYKEKWRFVAMPAALKQAVESNITTAQTESGIDVEPLLLAAGVGVGTEYGKWLQECLLEGSWLRTSPLMTQFRAKRSSRVDVEVPALVPPLSSKLVQADKFKLLWARKWRWPSEHINLKEGRVLLSSLKRASRIAELFEGKKLSLSDNLSALLAFDKGRSSSHGLNSLCRRAAGLLGATGIRWKLRHVETDRNVADSPSRWFEKRTKGGRFISRPLQTRSVVEPVVNSFQPYPSDNKEVGGYSRSTSSSTLRRRKIILADVVPPPGLFCQDCCFEVTVNTAMGEECCHDPAGACYPPFLHQPKANDVVTSKQIGHVGDNGKVDNAKHKKPVCLEVFAGKGRLSKSLVKAGCIVFSPIDIQLEEFVDLTNPKVQNVVRELIVHRRIDYIHFGTPCTVFSRARRNISDFKKARKKELIGCELATFTAEMCALAIQYNIAWSIENPRSSRVWEFPDIAALQSFPNVTMVNFDMCRFGQRFKKPTTILTNLRGLKALERRCCHKRHDEILCGRVKVQDGWKNRTELAGAYPFELCATWSKSVVEEIAGKHEKKQRGTINSSILKDLRCAFSKATDSQFIQHKGFDSDNLELIVFGQHSRAEAEKRRRNRRRQRLQKIQENKILRCSSGGRTTQTSASGKGQTENSGGV